MPNWRDYLATFDVNINDTNGIMCILFNETGKYLFESNEKVDLSIGVKLLYVLLENGRGYHFYGNDDFMYMWWL